MIRPLEISKQSPPQARAPVSRASDAFDDVFQRHLGTENQLRVSAHAAQRLERRNIQLPEEEWARINAALDRAAEKGARDSLVLADGLAMVVNVPNRTVITVLSPDETRENIFTQIDSAVVLPPRPKNFGIRPDPLAGGLHAADRMMRRNLKETQS